MTTITIKINERSTYGKAILDLIKLGATDKKGVEIVKVPNAETLKAFQEIKDGKVIKAKNAKELMKKLLA